MTDLEKPKAPRKKKPPTQTAGVTGIDGHGAMGAAPTEPAIDWFKLAGLPAFQMFVYEQSRFDNMLQVTSWVNNRRDALGDTALYKLYSDWHKDKNYWPNETPLGELK